MSVVGLVGGEAADQAGGVRSRFAYRVAVGGQVFSGEDLYVGVGARVSAAQMLGVFASFLADAGERYRTGMCPPDAEDPELVYEQAYLAGDELSMIASELNEHQHEHDHEHAVVVDSPVVEERWVSIVFQQGDDADEALAIVDEHGPDAAIEYLAQWDYGEETESAAPANGHVYESAPTARGIASTATGTIT